VPITINSVQHPLPTPKRCFDFGRAVGRAIESYPEDLKVVVLGTGGLSHQLDGERAGFINKEFDLWCIDRIVYDPEALTKLTVRDIVEKAGSQGVELLTWIAMRGAMTGHVTNPHKSYHIPISNTASAVMLFENNQVPAAKAA